LEIKSGESEGIHIVKPKLTEIDFSHLSGGVQIRIIEVTRIEGSHRIHLSSVVITYLHPMLHMSLLFFAPRGNYIEI
jgi:hypothetical protein